MIDDAVTLKPYPDDPYVTPENAAKLNKQAGASEAENRVHVQGGMVYLGTSPDSPQIGDARVTFTEV
ncbi:MAG: TMEM43 family protein, partial [Deltaproteobacteria bacterium]|nr:TMEM43 family protein [Deltaproteobacteria bacterium]